MNQLIWSIQFDGTNTALLDRDTNNYRYKVYKVYERGKQAEIMYSFSARHGHRHFLDNMTY